MEIARSVNEAYKLMQLIRAYSIHGHMLADVDPLQLFETYK